MPVETAMNELMTIKQGEKTNVLLHAAKIEALGLRAHAHEDQLISFFLKSLRPALQTAVVKANMPTTYREFVSATNQMNIRMLNAAPTNPTNSKHRPKPATAQKNEQSSSNANSKKLTPAEKERRTKEGLCWFCGKPGHNALNCPEKSLGKTSSQTSKRE